MRSEDWGQLHTFWVLIPHSSFLIPHSTVHSPQSSVFMAFETKKIHKNPQKLKKSSLAANQLTTPCATLIPDIILPPHSTGPNIPVPLILIGKIGAVIKIEGSLEEAGCIIASPEKRPGASQQLSKTSWCCCTRRATGPEHCQWGRLVQPG